MENYKKLTREIISKHLYKYFIVSVIFILPLAMVVSAVTKLWTLAWVCIGIWSLCTMQSIITSCFVEEKIEINKKTEKIHIKREINFGDSNLSLVQKCIAVVLITSYITLFNTSAMANAIDLSHGINTLVGTLAVVGVTGNILIQYGVVYGRASWGMILVLNSLAMLGIVYSAMGKSIVAALLFCLPTFIAILGSLFFTVNSQYSNINQDNSSFKRKVLCQIFVEEYINDRDTAQKRWRKKGLTALEIRLKTILLDLDTLKGLLVCKIQNIGLDRKKIE